MTPDYTLDVNILELGPFGPMPAIQCALRLFHSFTNETTKINYQFLNVSESLRNVRDNNGEKQRDRQILAALLTCMFPLEFKFQKLNSECLSPPVIYAQSINFTALRHQFPMCTGIILNYKID